MLVENLRPIGKLVRLQGFEGEAVLINEEVFFKKIDKTEWVFLIIEGLPVPFFVLSFQIRSESMAILKLEDVNSPRKMEAFLGFQVFVEETRKRIQARKISSHLEVSGYSVIDSTHGKIGIAKAVINYSDNFLLQLFQGDVEILIPVNEEIIGEIDDTSKTIYVNTPQGLLDLYL
jgi:16S rRNA processing protein RimM